MVGWPDSDFVLMFLLWSYQPKFCEKGGDNMVNDFDKKKDKDSKYTFVSSNFEARTSFLF